MMLAALYHLSDEFPCLWGMFGYGSDAALTSREMDSALSTVAQHGGLLGTWGMTPSVAARAVTTAPSLEAANTILCNLGVRTEYEFEREMLRCGVWHYDQA